MKKLLFYPKLAITNIKNNSKNYLPFIITCIATVLMFYNMAALTYNKTTGSGSLGMLMSMSAVVTAIFCVIFIFYTNSFLIKRRKKEFGLFNILGMEKKHIGKIMFWENTIVATTSILLGLLFGILFSKMVTLLLYKILQFDPVYKFEININAIIRTLILFSIIFILTLISSLVQVGKSKTIELLQGGAV
ncbi:MAG: FtsX-like permease family protein, partial [Oscillospiraceae bacterium]